MASTSGFLLQSGVFLAAAAIAAPIAKKLNVSSVLGYLAAGILIGPFGLGFVYSVYQVDNILHIAEYGVVLLLFLIGLELRPKRLWAMRSSIFGLGSAQVLITAAALTPFIAIAGLPWTQASFVALALALSSTAFVLQVLEEKKELTARHGRAAFSILLLQDLAAIPLIAIVPLLAGGLGEESFSFFAVIKALGAILLVFIVGRYVLSTLYHLVAMTGVKEAMTASALLTVVSVALLMQVAGLSAALGAFLAGALLADSSYRHQIEADIAPFEGLLLGLFFTAIGMGLNLNLLSEQPGVIFTSVLALISIKGTILFALGKWHGLDNVGARRLAFAMCQGGEFAFVLFATALGENVMDKRLAEQLTVIVTLSILATPFLLLADELFASRRTPPGKAHDAMPKEQGHVIIAGFGRFGQIVARVLRARAIPFTALDISAEQIGFVAKFGAKAYFGDAGSLNILHAAQIEKASAFVLAIDDAQTSIKIAETIRQNYPDLEIFARARNRRHAHQLMDLGVKTIRRETFLASLELSRELLEGLGFSASEASRTVTIFRERDEQRLYDDYAHYTDMDKLAAHAKKMHEELEELFSQDVQDLDEVLPDKPGE